MKQVSTTDYANAKGFPTAKLARKDEVLAFMRSQTPFCATAGHFNDATTGKPVEGIGWGWYRSGGWQWSDRDTYHVERYDLELDPEFVAYVLDSHARGRQIGKIEPQSPLLRR